MSMRLNDSRDSIQGGLSFDCFNVARTPRERRTCIIGAIIITLIVLSLIIAVVVLAIHSGSKDSCVKTACTSPPGPTGNTSTNPDSTVPTSVKDQSTITTPTSQSETTVLPLICNTTQLLQTTCTSADCNLEAADLLYKIDENVDPCEDFFKYACGRWLEEDVVRNPPFDHDSSFTELQLKIHKRIRDILKSPNSPSVEPPMRKAKMAYDSCMKEAVRDINGTIWKLSKELGGWPMLEGDEWKPKINIATLDGIFAILPTFRKYTEVGVLFKTSVLPDFSNTSRNVPVFSQATPLFLTNRSPEQSEAIYKMFWELISYLNPLTHEHLVRKEVATLLELNDAISNASVPNNPLKLDYTSLTIQEFKEATSQINVNWLQYLNSVFLDTGKILEENGNVDVIGLDYFKNLTDKLKDYDEDMGRAIINYEMLMVLKNTKVISSALFTKDRGLGFQRLTNPLPGVTASEKWFSCASLISEWFAYVIAPEYERLYVNQSSVVSTSEDLTSYVIAAFKKRLTSLDWLGEDGKKKASEKIDQIKRQYSYPKWASNKQAVNKFYDSLSVGESHLENQVNYATFYAQGNYKRINGDDDSANPAPWLVSPLTVNAFYNNLDNSINILQAIMQPPVFDSNRLKVMNFGVLGMIIGHEITHGFDTTGRQFDAKGNLHEWMDSSATEKFHTRTKCFIDQYESYSLTNDDLPGYDGPTVKIDGVRTVAENIADAGGIQNAYKAYKMWEEEHGKEVLPEYLRNKFSHDKLFFISYANSWCTKYSYGAPPLQTFAQDTHSPPRIRIIGALTNSEDFSRAFNCKPSAAMARSKRCVLW